MLFFKLRERKEVMAVAFVSGMLIQENNLSFSRKLNFVSHEPVPSQNPPYSHRTERRKFCFISFIPQFWKCSDDMIKNKCENQFGICDEITPKQTLLIAIQSVTPVRLRWYDDVLQIKAWLSRGKMISWQCNRRFDSGQLHTLLTSEKVFI